MYAALTEFEKVDIGFEQYVDRYEEESTDILIDLANQINANIALLVIENGE